MENKIERISIIAVASLIVLVCIVALFSWLSTKQQEDSLYRDFQTADLQTFELHGFVKEVSIDGKTFCRFDNQGRLTYIDFEGAKDLEGYSLGMKYSISYEDDPEFGTMTDEYGDICDYTRENGHITRFKELREGCASIDLITWDYDSNGRRISTNWNLGGGGQSQTFSDFLPNGIHQKVVQEWDEAHSCSTGKSVGTLSDFVYDEFGNWTSMTIHFENSKKKVKRTITYYDKNEVDVHNINIVSDQTVCDSITVAEDYTEEPVEDVEENIAAQIEAIDLGLSVKWANCNIGAESPEAFGDYYAWGELATKDTYTEDNYSFGFRWGLNDLIQHQIINSHHILYSKYDVATTCLSDKWRMPTRKDFEELARNCQWSWTTKNNVKGMLVTGCNGNSIFLPAAGYYNHESYNKHNGKGYYWTSEGDVTTPYAFFFTDVKGKMYNIHEYWGLPVRAVYDEH